MLTLTPLPHIVVLLLLVFMYIFTNAHAQTALKNGDVFNNNKYTAPITYDANAKLKDEKAFSSTIMWKGCAVSNKVTIQGTFNIKKTFATSVYLTIQSTAFSGIGQFYFNDLPPNTYVHAVGSTGSKAQVTTFDIRPTTESNNITTLIDASTIAYDAEILHIQFVNLAVRDSSPYIVTHLRNAKLTGAFTIFQTTTCTKGSTIFLEKITCTKCHWDLIYLKEITSLSEQSAIILKEIDIVGHTRSQLDGLLRTGDFVNIDATSVLAVIDIDLTDNFGAASPLRLFYGTQLSGTGAIVFLRIKMGPSGLDSPQPADNRNFWVAIKNNPSRIMNVNELRAAKLNVNVNNVINWDGTGTNGKCVQAGLALPGTATYTLVKGKCEATCPKGNYLPPACTPRAECTGVPNCQACYAHPKTLCLECLPHTTAINGDTVCQCPIRECINCPTETLCTLCSEGFKYSAELNSCFHCTIAKCTVCSEDDKCFTCDTGYKLHDNKCIACDIDKCSYCKEAGKCFECLADHKLTSDKKKCFHCTMPGCKECSADGVCKDCDAGYYFLESTSTPTNNKCVRCAIDVENCIKCETDSICSECSNDHKLANEGKHCFHCTIPFCDECRADRVCGECDAGYYLLKSANTPTDNKCVRCTIDVPNCVRCETDGMCSECSTDHKLTADGRSCFHCTVPNCKECSTDGVCSFCDAGYSLVESEDTPTDNKCVRCSIDVPDCHECKVDGICSQCLDDGYTLSPDGRRCTLCHVDDCQRCDLPNVCALCNAGMAAGREGQCTPCDIGNCTYCSGDNTCGLCSCEMVSSDDGKKCVSCSAANCKYCDHPGGGTKCAECMKGYKASSSGACTKITVPQWGVFLIVVFACIALVITVVVAFVIWQRCKASMLQKAMDAEERRRNRQRQSNIGRQNTNIAILDLTDIESAASGVRDTLRS